jgi:hypothetical protein
MLKPNATNTEDIKYFFDTTPICSSDEGWGHSRHNKEERNPEPLNFGQPMQGRWHKYDREYTGITWNCGALFGTTAKLTLSRYRRLT